jgi:hypothetical protein
VSDLEHVQEALGLMGVDATVVTLPEPTVPPTTGLVPVVCERPVDIGDRRYTLFSWIDGVVSTGVVISAEELDSDVR